MLSRRLALKKETLAELANEDLRAVAGGSAGPTCYTCVVTDCYHLCNTTVLRVFPTDSPGCPQLGTIQTQGVHG